jgi:hypothetical protein
VSEAREEQRTQRVERRSRSSPVCALLLASILSGAGCAADESPVAPHDEGAQEQAACAAGRASKALEAAAQEPVVGQSCIPCTITCIFGGCTTSGAEGRKPFTEASSSSLQVACDYALDRAILWKYTYECDTMQCEYPPGYIPTVPVE